MYTWPTFSETFFTVFQTRDFRDVFALPVRTAQGGGGSFKIGNLLI